jgi:Zn finger protein HypA/HybF involved in hydrogenase expression
MRVDKSYAIVETKGRQFECYGCNYVGVIEDFFKKEELDLMDVIDGVRMKIVLRCPDCDSHNLGPSDED